MDTREDKKDVPASPGASRLDDGGPAFPIPAPVVPVGHYATYTEALGMSLRDYFAAKAMQGLLADAWMRCESLSRENLCKDAWSFADAMLAARRTA